MRMIMTFFVVMVFNAACHSTSGQANSGSENSLKTSEKVSTLKSYPADFTFIHIKNFRIDNSSKFATFNLQLMTSLEIFCERRCSKFALDIHQNGTDLEVMATKTPTPGNTSPSRLNEIRPVSFELAKTARIIFKNCGRAGNDVSLDVKANKWTEGFIAGFGEIKKTMAIGGESSGLSVILDGKSFDAIFEDQKLAAQASTSSKGKLVGFMTGELTGRDGVERGKYPIVVIKTFNTAITEE